MSKSLFFINHGGGCRVGGGDFTHQYLIPQISEFNPIYY